jgi:hypothetical protein
MINKKMRWFSFCKTKKTKNEKTKNEKTKKTKNEKTKNEKSRRDNRKMTTRREPPTKINLNADKGPRTTLLSASARQDLDDMFFM